MKKLLLGSLALCAAMFMADAGNLAGKKIYLNPGHGGYEASKGTRIPGVFANGYRSDGSDATDRWNAPFLSPMCARKAAGNRSIIYGADSNCAGFLKQPARR